MMKKKLDFLPSNTPDPNSNYVYYGRTFLKLHSESQIYKIIIRWFCNPDGYDLI